jgi:hypothetical protein
VRLSWKETGTRGFSATTAVMVGLCVVWLGASHVNRAPLRLHRHQQQQE